MSRHVKTLPKQNHKTSPYKKVIAFWNLEHMRDSRTANWLTEMKITQEKRAWIATLLELFFHKNQDNLEFRKTAKTIKLIFLWNYHIFLRFCVFSSVCQLFSWNMHYKNLIIKSPFIFLQAGTVIIHPRYRQRLAWTVKVNKLVHSVFWNSSAVREISDEFQFLKILVV